MILSDFYNIDLESMWLLQLHSDRDSYNFIAVPSHMSVCRQLLQSASPNFAADCLGGAGAEETQDETTWERRHLKRCAAVAAIHRSPEYVHFRASHVPVRCPTPDPWDRQLSKRQWEAAVMRWRRSLRSSTASTLTLPTYADTCLVVALQMLGVPVVAPSDGPFWALRDGNRMLAPFNMQLSFLATRPLPAGRYVAWIPREHVDYGHFSAVVVGVISAEHNSDGTSSVS